MFAEKLYSTLGVPPEASVVARISHYGLDGRTLGSASSRRYVIPAVSIENESSSEVETMLGQMKQTRVADVKKPLEPMFMLFEFREFNEQVYEEIVRSFESGRII
jgi:hypothetical protein